MANGRREQATVVDHSTNRLSCGGPTQGVTDNTAVAIEWRPNIMLGSDTITDATLINGTDGVGADGYSAASSPALQDTGNFSIEMWVKRQYPDSVSTWQTVAAAACGYCFTGVYDNTTNTASAPVFGTSGAARIAGAGFQFRGADFEAVYQTGAGAGATFLFEVAVLPMGWHHVCATFNRTGNMTVYVDGVSEGTEAINATDLGLGYFALQYCARATAAAVSGKVETPYTVAGVAYHAVVLTAAQIENSVRNHTLQTLGTGSTGTVFCLFPADIQLVEHRGWDAQVPAEVSPATAAASATGWVAVRSGLATITAEQTGVVMQVDRLTTALPDLKGVVSSWGSEPGDRHCAFIRDRNRANGYCSIHVPIELEFASEQDVSIMSPAFGHDPTWPPSGGVSGAPYA